MGITPKEQYGARLKRFHDAVSLKGPDRVPIIPLTLHYYDTKIAGISNQEAMYEVEKRYRIWKDFVLQLNFDMAPAIGTFPAKPLDILGAKYYKWPGGGLPSNQPFQWVEQEYMQADEYDVFLSNPGDFVLRVLWPRMSKTLEPLALLPPLHWIGPQPTELARFTMQPGFISALKSLIKIGEEWKHWFEVDARYTAEIEEAGYPLSYVVYSGHTAFDMIADYFRGMRGIMLDMFRLPDKLLAAIDIFTEMQLNTLIADAKASGNPRVPLWLHRGAALFMSDEQFKKFYWPSLRTLLIGLVEAGLVPIPYFQGDYTPRLPYLTELPKGTIPFHFDVINRKEAQKIIGGLHCFWGNVSASLLITGTPQQVREDVIDLIDTFASTGGLIIDGAMTIPDEAKPENIDEMIATVLDYGVN